MSLSFALEVANPERMGTQLQQGERSSQQRRCRSKDAAGLQQFQLEAPFFPMAVRGTRKNVPESQPETYYDLIISYV